MAFFKTDEEKFIEYKNTILDEKEYIGLVGARNTDYTLTEDSLRDMLLKEFTNIKKRNAERRKNISKILKDRLERELANIDKDLSLFEEAKNG